MSCRNDKRLYDTRNEITSASYPFLAISCCRFSLLLSFQRTARYVCMMCRKLDHLPLSQPLSGATYSAVELADGDDCVWMLDQRCLPQQQLYWEYRTAKQVAEGIKQMVVRGAPAIGIAAAYAMVLAARQRSKNASNYGDFMTRTGHELKACRPTAVNLAWAVDRCLQLVRMQVDEATPSDQRVRQLACAARKIHLDDVKSCKKIGQYGAALIPDGATILTHCNAGALATGGYGTALGVVRAVRDAGKTVRVLADETRPYMQGMRLTAWELHRDGIDVKVIADNMAAHFLAQKQVDAIVVGADRIANNGDVANKIGTYALACLAKMHECPFYVAAPISSVDFACPSGQSIPIEQRDPQELLMINGKLHAPRDVDALYPAFDVTPHHLVTAIFTELGVVDPVDTNSMADVARKIVKEDP